MPQIAPAFKELSSVLRQWDGKLTRDLALRPAGFGLGRVPAERIPEAIATSVCGFCATGCSLDVHLKQGAAVGLTPTADYPVNLGMACPKGWESLTPLKAADRATTPLLRGARGKLAPVDWHTAMTIFCDRFKTIQRRYGSESIAFLSTGQIPTEEMALLGSLAKFGMGMLHGDGNTRQCMATAAVAYKESFGFDAPPYTYQDLEESDVIVLVGSNLCIAHPILWQRICRNPHRPEIIVVDPRKTETAMAATLHLPLRPKSDLSLFYGLAHILLDQGWIDHAFITRHTSGFDEFRQHLRHFPSSEVAAATGIDVSTLNRVAHTIHQGRRVSFWWTMGVNQSYQGVRTAQSLINLALMTGNLGRPGTGANSITGQCNAMGSRLFSNTTNLLGGRDFENAADRHQVADILEIDVARIPDRNSWSYDKILEGILGEKIKGLWIIATNPAHSWINQNTLHDVLGRLDFLVVQDMYHTTQTAKLADLVLPAAGWGEKRGTLINSERRVGKIEKVAQAPGQALADFSIFRLIAQYWGCEAMFHRWTDPEAVFQILKELSSGRPCDFSGIAGYATLDRCGGVQWPFPADMRVAARQRRLFADGKFFHADGRARFCQEMPRPMEEPPNRGFPLLLITGRGSASQWHTGTRTEKSPVLAKLHPRKAYAEINPEDARKYHIRPNQEIIVRSQRGKIRAKAFVVQRISPGQIFIPMHYESVNQLTLAHFDPYSRQPSYKNCAVMIRPVSTNDGRSSG